MRQIAVAIIRSYQYAVSPFLGQRCRFYPSCSEYAVTAIGRFGVLRGGWLTVCRVSRCHPLHTGGYDPVPETNHAVHKHSTTGA